MTNYFNPGEVYTFRCLSLDGLNTKVISIVFDNNANATVNFSTDSVLATDRRELVIFAPQEDYLYIDNPPSAKVQITAELSLFWYIIFDENLNPILNATTIPDGNEITITCPCGQGTGDCTVSSTGSGNCKKINCDTTTNCTLCNPPKVTKGTVTSQETFVLIKANNVTL